MEQGGDMRFYHLWALRIAQGELADHQAFYGMPGYAYVLALIYRLIGVEPFAMGLLQVASEALIAFFIYKLSLAALGAGRIAHAVGLLAGCGWLLFEPAQAFAVVLMPTSWLVLGFWGVVLLASKERSPWGWLGIGLLLGLTAVLVATVLLLIPLVFFAVLRSRQRASALAAAVFGIVVGTAPCWGHNYFIAREPVLFSAHSGLNFYIGNNPAANGYPKMPPGMRTGQQGMLKDSITLAEAEEGRPLKRYEVSRHWSSKADAFIREHTGQWLWLMAKKVGNFWHAHQYDDLGLITLLSVEGVLVPGLRFGVVAALAIPGMLMGLRRYRQLGWVAAAVLLHLFALLPVFITERYRLAAVPGLLIFAALGLVLFGQALVARNWRGALGYLLLVLVAWMAVHWPCSDRELKALDDYNTGFRALEAGKLQRAREFLERTYAQAPRNTETNFALGNLWMRKGDPQKAKHFYGRTLELNAQHEGAYNNLGVIALDEKRWQTAENLLKRSVAIDPEDAETYYLLARARLGAGDPDQARRYVAKALQLEPGRALFRSFAQELARPAADAQPALLPERD